MLVLPLHQPHGLAGIDVGNFVHHLQPVHQAHLPVIPGIVLPISTLRLIADDNNLEQKLTGMLGPHVSLQQVTDFFAHLKLRSDVSRELLREYHESLDGHPVVIFPSWVKSLQTPTSSSETHQGDAQVIEAMLREWGRSTWYVAQQHTLQPWLAAAIVAVVYPANGIEVTVATKAKIGDKNSAITVKTTPTQTAHYQVDVRTWHVISRSQDVTQQPLLSDATLIELAQQSYQAKRLTIEHLLCTWQMVGQKWYVTTCEPLFTHDAPSVTPSLRSTPTWQGRGAVPGQVRGQVSVVANQGALPSKWSQPTILVTHHVQRLELSQLRNLLGVICEQGCDPQPFQLLRQFGIPTILQVSRATQSLRSLQTIELNADLGTITNVTSNTPAAPSAPASLAVISWLPNEVTAIPTQQAQHLPPAGYVLGMKHLEAKVGIPGQTVRPLLHLPYTWVRLEWSPTRHSSQLQSELETIHRAEKWWPNHPHLITPPLHASVEADLFLTQLTRSGLAHDWPLWWHVSTPENILNVHTYLHQLKPRGVTIDVIQLLSRITGIQFWDQSVAAMYPQPTELLVEFMRHFHQELAQARLPVFWRVPYCTTKLLSAAIRFQVAGLMVSPYHVGETYLLLEQHLTTRDSTLWQ